MTVFGRGVDFGDERRHNVLSDKRQLRRIRRKYGLRVQETATLVMVHFNDPGREIRGSSDLTMELETGLKIRLAAVHGYAQPHYRSMNFGHGRMVADDGTIAEF